MATETVWTATEAGMRLVASDGSVWDIVECGNNTEQVWLTFNGEVVDSLSDRGSQFASYGHAMWRAANSDAARA